MADEVTRLSRKRKGWPPTAIAAVIAAAIGGLCLIIAAIAPGLIGALRDGKGAERPTTPPGGVAEENYPCDATIRAYYAALSSGSFLDAWDSLTRPFQELRNPTGPEAFAEYWSRTPVEVMDVRQTGASDVFAVCHVWLRYSLTGDDRYLEMHVVFDQDAGAWRIESEEVLDTWGPE